MKVHSVHVAATLLLAALVLVLAGTHPAIARLRGLSPPPASSLFDSSEPSSLSSVGSATRLLPGCATRGRARTFVIIFISRSASTAISSIMNVHPDIHNAYEALVHANVAPSSPAAAVAAAAAIFEEGARRNVTVGFKMRPSHLLYDPRRWGALFRRHSTHIVWQYRRNVLKAALGIYRARVLNDTTATGGIRRHEMRRVRGDRCKLGVGCSFAIHRWDALHTIMTNRVRQEFDVVSAIHAVREYVGDCVLDLPYEDFLHQPVSTIQRLYDFLAVDKADAAAHVAKSMRLKATDDRVCKVVSNFDDLCNYLYGCRIWSAFIEEDGGSGECKCTAFNHSLAVRRFCAVKSRDDIAAASAVDTARLVHPVQ